MKKRVRQTSSRKVIGVDIGGTKIAAGTVVNGTLIDAVEIPVMAKANAKKVFSQICSVIDLLYTPDICAICVGFPGVVIAKRGFVVGATNIPRFKHIPLKQWLSHKYKSSDIFIQNDAKCFALGQLSSVKAEKHIVGLILGTGVGAGVIMNRRIMTGKDGTLGEVGAWISSHGNSFEELLGGHDFVTQYHTTGKELFEKASSGNMHAKKLFESYGTHLAELLAIIIVTYAPQRIVLGGSVSKSAKFFLPITKRVLKSYKLRCKNPEIVVAAGKYPGVIGAAALVKQEK